MRSRRCPSVTGRRTATGRTGPIPKSKAAMMPVVGFVPTERGIHDDGRPSKRWKRLGEVMTIR